MAETRTRRRTRDASGGVDLDWARDFVERWAAAWNSHEPHRVLDLMTQDIAYDDSAWPQTMHGHGEVRAFIDMTWRAFPDLEFEAIGGPLLSPEAPRAAFWWRGTATHRREIE